MMWLPLPLLLLALPALALADDACKITADGSYYDLSPLIAKKDYQVKVGERNFLLNVCRSVVDPVWHVHDAPDESKIGGKFRWDHGDFSIGQYNTTLTVDHGNPMLLYTGGSPCSNDKKVRAATAIRFVCDSNVFEHGTPQLIAQLPPDSEWPCGFVFEWRTYLACPGSSGSTFGLIMKILSVILLCTFLLYVGVGTAYRYYVLGLRGKKIIPITSNGLSVALQSVTDLFSGSSSNRFVRLPDRSRTAGGRWSRGGGNSHYDSIDADDENEPLNGPDNPFTLDDDEPPQPPMSAPPPTHSTNPTPAPPPTTNKLASSNAMEV